MKKLLKKVLISKEARNAAVLSAFMATVAANTALPWADSPTI